MPPVADAEENANTPKMNLKARKQRKCATNAHFFNEREVSCALNSKRFHKESIQLTFNVICTPMNLRIAAFYGLPYPSV